MLRLEDASRRFGSTWALDGLTLEVPEGEVHALLGPNGAGKTTALRVLATLETLTAGTATVDGRSVASQAEAARRRIGYLGHGSPTYPSLTPREHLAFDHRARAGAPDGPSTDGLLEALDLPPDTPANHLSRGNLRRLGLARALAGDPPALLLDEPFADLDAPARRAAADLVARGDRTVLLASHDLDRALDLARRVHVLRDGRRAGTVDASDPDRARREVRELQEGAP